LGYNAQIPEKAENFEMDVITPPGSPTGSPTGSDGKQSAPAMEGLTPEELYRAGTQHFRLRDYSKARAFLERYSELRPGDAEACHLLARVLYHEGQDLEKAEGCLKKAVELDPGSETRYLATLAEIYIHQSRYAKAEEVLVYAIAKDNRQDSKHTYALEFYLNLVKKKGKQGVKEKAAPKKAEKKAEKKKKEGLPAFLATEMGRIRTARREPFFILPSIIAHLLVLGLVAFLSGYDLPIKPEPKEDVAYVEVDTLPEQPQAQVAAAPAEAPEQEAAPAAPKAAKGVKGIKEPKVKTAPVTAKKSVETAGPKKESAEVTEPDDAIAIKEVKEKRPTGKKGKAALKHGKKKEDKTLVASAAAPEKKADIKAKSHASVTDDVDLSRGGLGGVKAGKEKSGSKGKAAPGSLKERSGGAAATGGEGISTGSEKPTKGEGSKKGKASEIKPSAGKGDVGAAPLHEGDKGLSALPQARGPKRAEDGRLAMARPSLGIGAGGSSPGAAGMKAGGGVESLRAPDKSEVPVAGSGQGGVGFGPPEATQRGSGTGKKNGGLGTSESAQAKVGGITGGERGSDLAHPSGRAGSSGDPLADRRNMGLSASGGNKKGEKPSGGAGAGREALAGLDKKGEESAAPGAGGGAGQVVAERPGTGTRGGATAGKGVNGKALEAGEGKGTGASSLIAKAGDRVSDMLGLGGKTKKGGSSDTAPRRAGDLSGLAGGSTKGQAAPGASKGRNGVKLGSGEKSEGRAAASSVSGAAKAGGAAAQAGAKKMAEGGTLGVPGGSGADRYASAGRGEASPTQTERLASIPRGGKGARAQLGPRVAIISPKSGPTKQLSQVVKGTVSDARLRKATLAVNSDSRVISVENGAFEATVALVKGRNVVTVMAYDADGNAGKDSVTLDYAEPTSGMPVTIVSPRDGQVFDVSERSTIIVKGTVGDHDIKRAKLILNGNPMDIAVSDGRFAQQVALVQEQNTVLVEAVGKTGDVSRSGAINIGTINVKPKEIMVILTWDKPHADLDLHIYGPHGGHTSFKSPSIYESNDAIPGGQLEQDAKANFGPEVFTQTHADKGVYTIKSNYYYSGGDGNATATVTVILYGDNPSRRQMRVFGPHVQVDTKTGEDMWSVTKIKMPEGIFLED